MIIRKDTDPKEAQKIRQSINAMHQKIEDFFTIRATINSDNPERDAWKAVFGYDNPAFDETTKEGQEEMRKVSEMFGVDTDAQEKIKPV